MKVVIIEDELLASRELKRMLQRIDDDIEVISDIQSVQAGVEWFENNKSPDLVFSDIQLSDGLSFELFQRTSIDCPVIFTTAFDHYAIQAFKLNSIDYLMKPFDDEDVANALEKFRNLEDKRHENPINKELLDKLISQHGIQSYKSSFVVSIGDQYRKIKVEDIACFRADGNTVYLIQQNKKRVIVDYSIEELEKLLDPSVFFRINRQVLIHEDAISRIHKYFNSRLKLETEPCIDEDVLVSRSRVKDFLRWLDN
ncbi:MAG TPA: DNA-binding response regulator [Flavobacteriales bacterium]|jgi:DNA-binding LytR/AlgR family response regulator|nr:DNA-binding response regulator [Flavobacteriales bacterium]